MVIDRLDNWLILLRVVHPGMLYLLCFGVNSVECLLAVLGGRLNASASPLLAVLTAAGLAGLPVK